MKSAVRVTLLTSSRASEARPYPPAAACEIAGRTCRPPPSRESGLGGPCRHGGRGRVQAGSIGARGRHCPWRARPRRTRVERRPTHSSRSRAMASPPRTVRGERRHGDLEGGNQRLPSSRVTLRMSLSPNMGTPTPLSRGPASPSPWRGLSPPSRREADQTMSPPSPPVPPRHLGYAYARSEARGRRFGPRSERATKRGSQEHADQRAGSGRRGSRGSRTVNTVPPSRVDSTATDPPCAIVICRTM
jgi:hypothetical protein